MYDQHKLEEPRDRHTFKIGAYVPMPDLVQAVSTAHSIGANILMSYTGSPKNAARKSIDTFKIAEGWALMAELGITDLVIHAPYIINLASSDPVKSRFAIDILSEEIVRTSKLCAYHLVVHTGYYKGSTFERG